MKLKESCILQKILICPLPYVRNISFGLTKFTIGYPKMILMVETPKWGVLSLKDGEAKTN